MSTEEILELIDKRIAEWDSVKTWEGICKRDALKELKAEIEKCILKEEHDMDNIIEATEYCLTKGKCTDCKFSKGKMFATCRYLVEDMSKLLKELK